MLDLNSLRSHLGGGTFQGADPGEMHLGLMGVLVQTRGSFGLCCSIPLRAARPLQPTREGRWHSPRVSNVFEMQEGGLGSPAVLRCSPCQVVWLVAASRGRLL